MSATPDNHVLPYETEEDRLRAHILRLEISLRGARSERDTAVQVSAQLQDIEESHHRQLVDCNNRRAEAEQRRSLVHEQLEACQNAIRALDIRIRSLLASNKESALKIVEQQETIKALETRLAPTLPLPRLSELEID